MTDKEIILNLLEEFRVFKKETNKVISDLRKEVKELKEKLSKYENPKNSNNSNIPTSQDPNRQTRSLRKKSSKKVGNQKGHKLKKVSNPYKIILHNIIQCNSCQANKITKIYSKDGKY